VQHEAVRVFVVDDQAPFRSALVAALRGEQGLEVVGESGDAAECVRLAPSIRPDVILLDLEQPRAPILDAVASLRRACPEARILVLTASEEADALSAALRAGADGYLVKNIEGALLLHTVRRALDGAAILAAAAAAAHGEALHLRAENGERHRPVRVPRAALSPREQEILRLVALGESNKEIGRALGVAESTVKIHVQHILRKLKLSSRVQAAVYAAEHGLVPKGE
jgi:two-component system nitrate/nitrite response regulator NarL